MPAEQPKAFNRDIAARRVYITRRNLEQFGFTAGCPACDATRTGTRTPGIGHVEACRERIEKAMAEDPAQADRREKAEERVNEWFAKRMEDIASKQENEPGGGSIRPPPADVQVSTDRELIQPSPSAVVTSSSSNGSGLIQPPPSDATSRSTSGSARPPQDPAQGPAPMEGVRMQRKRIAEQQLDPTMDGDLDEEMVSSIVQETRKQTIERMICNMSTDSDWRPVCEEPDELDDSGYFDAYFDDVTGRELDPDKVREARSLELDFISSIGVWKPVARRDLEKDTFIVKGRWVDVNKGDEQHPNYRSRYVAKEFKRGTRSSLAAEFFAAIPPTKLFKIPTYLSVYRAFPRPAWQFNQTTWNSMHFLH